MLESGLDPQQSSATGYHRRLRRRRYLSLTTVLLACALVALFAGAGLLARQVETTRNSMILRTDLGFRTRQLQTVLTLLQDAETGQRGLLLTHKPEYLGPYVNAVAQLPGILADASTRNADDAEITARIDRIRRLSGLKLAELAETIRLYNEGSHAASMQLVLDDTGEKYMEDLRAELGLAIESLRTQVVVADEKSLGEMVIVKRLAWWSAIALTLTILLAAFQLRALSKLRSASEEKLATQTSILNTVVDEIPTAMAIWDRGYHYRLVNKAFERWRGRPRQSVIGKGIAEVIGEKEFAVSKPWIERAMAGEAVSFEKEYEDGDVRHIKASYSPLFMSDGSVGGVVAVAYDITIHHEERARLKRLAERDSLTKLLNRPAFELWLSERITADDGNQLAVLYIDLDHFKPVNDHYGHAVGDAVLQEFAKRLQRVIRPTDVAARLGGDEFGVALCGIRSHTDAQLVADKIITEIKAPMLIGKDQILVGASVGIATNAAREGGWQSLVQHADEMLYRAKRSGRGSQPDIHCQIVTCLKARDWFEPYPRFFQPGRD
jgi:diguanylate cyclase (GGDEF)-like protein/PAS domain S-box-containing protein